MSAPDRAELARRLFGSVRHQRPRAELEARILAAGRAELEQGRLNERALDARRPFAPNHLDPSRGFDAAPDVLGLVRRERRRAIKARWRLGALAAAAGLVIYLGLGRAPRHGVLISAERPGTLALPRAAGEREPAVAGADAPGAAEPERADPRAAPVKKAKATASASDAPSTDIAPGPRGTDVGSGRSTARFVAPAADAKHAGAKAASTTPVLRGPATSARAPSVPEAHPASLGPQLEQIKMARAALRAGDYQRALELLDAYRAQPAGAAMAAEASLLRIEALAASGLREDAARAARQFASDFPNSPLIDRALSYAAGGSER